MFSAVSNVLPLYVRQELPATDPPLEPPRSTAAAAVETPRAPTAAERRADAGSDPARGRERERRSSERSDHNNLSEKELREVQRMKARDAEVRNHERAHAAAGGAHAGAPNYKYERGPDGRMYAVSGHVSIDTSKVPGDPEATVRKMRQIQRAALAPAEPSAQDRKVAAKAAAKAARAQQEAQAARRAEATEKASDGTDGSGGDPVPGAGAEAAVQAQRSGQAYQRESAGSQVPELELLACRDCGGVHTP